MSRLRFLLCQPASTSLSPASSLETHPISRAGNSCLLLEGLDGHVYASRSAPVVTVGLLPAERELANREIIPPVVADSWSTTIERDAPTLSPPDE